MELNEYHPFLPYWYITVEAIVKEAFTNKSEQKIGQFWFAYRTFALEVDAKESILRNGLPYIAELKFKGYQTPIKNQPIQICYCLLGLTNVKYIPSWCSNFSVDVTKVMPFTIPPLASNVTKILLNVSTCK